MVSFYITPANCYIFVPKIKRENNEETCYIRLRRYIIKYHCRFGAKHQPCIEAYLVTPPTRNQPITSWWATESTNYLSEPFPKEKRARKMCSVSVRNSFLTTMHTMPTKPSLSRHTRTAGTITVAGTANSGCIQ